MPRTRPAYSHELREEILKRVAAGESAEDLAKRYEPSAPTIRNWVANEAKAEVVSSESGRTLAEVEEENRELRRQLREERESVQILKKAAAWFAAETRTFPKRSS